jgi:hypothetical protein
LAATPTWTDITSDDRRLKIKRGRTSLRNDFNAGEARMVVNNRAGDFDPTNTAGAYTPNVALHVPIRIQAVHSVTTYDLFRGHIATLPLVYPDNLDAQALLTATDNLPIINRTRLQAQTYAEESSDTRIGNILDDVGWPAADRNLDAGITDVAALADHSGGAWALIRKTVEAEHGAAFITDDGDFRFLGRTAWSSPSSSGTFGDGNLTISDFSRGYDDKILVNLAELKATATGAAQSATDATSITAHGTFDYAATNTSLLGDNEALNVAEWIVGTRKDYDHRIGGFTVYPQKDGANLWPLVLDLELGDVVTVNYIPPSGDTYNALVVIDHIEHDINPGLWVTKYRCHPLSTFETQDYWILDTSDDLDTNTILA